ncbi:MAG: hypothetical protein WDO69_08365 [Pseudomonadota bacterium]
MNRLIQRSFLAPELASSALRGWRLRRHLLALTLFIFGVSGLGFRFWLAKNSIGCDDANIWLEHARLIDAHGVGFAYAHPDYEQAKFNHPPLMGYLSLLALKLSAGDQLRFSWVIKAPGLLVELLSSYLVWRIWSRRGSVVAAAAFAAYATCLTSIAVSAFHCNTDCACAGLTLLAFYMFREKGRAFWSGVALAAALNVKIMPVFVIPVLLGQCRSVREALRFFAGLSLSVVPLVPFLVTVPRSVYSNIFAYNPIPIEWGIFSFLSAGNEVAPLAGHLTTFIGWFVREQRYVILLSVSLLGVLAFFKPRRFAYDLGAAAWALFLVLTPGFGVQYTACIVPLLFAADYRRATIYGLFAGVMVTAIYTARMSFVLPLRTYVQYYPIPHISSLCGLLTWVLLLAYLRATWKKLATVR